MYLFKIYKKERFIAIKLKDSIIQDIYDVFNEIRDHGDFSHGYNGIVDLRESKLNLEIKDLHEIATFIHDSPWVKGAWVLLNDIPENTVFSVLYKELTHTFHSIDVCSTTDKASDLLDIPVNDFLL